MPEFWIHYIGKHIYSIKRLEREAKRYGVQRAVPFHMIKKFRWGDRILLAHRLGKDAEVFGYFTVESITHNLPDSVVDKLLRELNAVYISSEPVYERRFCGGYYIGGVALVDSSIEEFYEKVKEVCKEFGIDPNKVKWFLRGRYTRLKNTIILSPAKFTRSYMKVEIEDLSLEPENLEKGVLVWVYNYKRRKYFRKGEAKLLEETKPLDDYIK